MAYVVKRPSETRRRGGPTKPVANRPRNEGQGVGPVIGKYFGFKPKLKKEAEQKTPVAEGAAKKPAAAAAEGAAKKAAKK